MSFGKHIRNQAELYLYRSTSGTKSGSFNKGASKQKEAAGKNTNTKVSPVKKSDAGSVWGKLPKK